MSKNTLAAHLARRPLIAAAAVAAAAVLLVALFAGVIAGYDPLEQRIEYRLQPPSRAHVFGTDGFGRDVFSRVLYGGRITVYIGLLSVGVASVVGIPIGTFMAYSGGLPDLLIGRIVDTFLGFPFIVLSIIVVVALPSSATAVAIAIAVVFTPRVIVLSRTSAKLVKQEPYIQAAQAIGARPARIIFRHMLPNSIGASLSQAIGYFGTAAATESILSYLGLGVPPPYPSWGRMLQEGTTLYFEAAPWLVIFPGMALFLVVICFSLLAENLKENYSFC